MWENSWDFQNVFSLFTLPPSLQVQTLITYYQNTIGFYFSGFPEFDFLEIQFNLLTFQFQICYPLLKYLYVALTRAHIKFFKRIWTMQSAVLRLFKMINRTRTNQPHVLHLSRSFSLPSTRLLPFSISCPTWISLLLPLDVKCQSALISPIQRYSCSKAEILYTLNQLLQATYAASSYRFFFSKILQKFQCVFCNVAVAELLCCSLFCFMHISSIRLKNP